MPATDRRPLECIIPPYILERLTRCSLEPVRRQAIRDLAEAAAVHAVRDMAREMPSFLARSSPTRGRCRMIHDAQGRDELPGKLVRGEGDPRHADAAVNEAYDHAGATYDFFFERFGRNSLDDSGMCLVASVHVGEADGDGYAPMNNAFFNGSQMAYGDGDGLVFRRFTRALDVVAHELTHGIQAFASNLAYRGESGALNEHFADVFGVLVRQWREAVRAAARARRSGQKLVKPEPSWLVGSELLVPADTRRAVRDMREPGTAFVDDPLLGTDPQPGHMRDVAGGPSDRGGVHLNSGIPNRAFVLAAERIGGDAWETPGRIWYDAMLQLSRTSGFADAARLTEQIAMDRFGSREAKAVREGWKAVGVRPARERVA